MKNKNTRDKFVKAWMSACKTKRDTDTKSWIENSMWSKEWRLKARITHKSNSHRKACSERELSKIKEQRTKLAKKWQQALVDKLWWEEAYKKYLSDRIKWRKKYINPETLQIKVVKEAITWWILLTEYNKNKELYP